MRAPAHAAVTAQDRKRSAALVTVVPMPGKGMGVVAVRDIPPGTLVANYPGHLYTLHAHSQRLAAGRTNAKYAISFYKLTSNHNANVGYVLDPGDGQGRLLPEFAAAVGPYVNEPDVRTGPNLLWVWNLPKYRLEMWTARPVRRGEELTVCYGNGGGYDRSYVTSCAARPGEVEPELHVVTRPRAKQPVPYSSLGAAGVRDAARRLAAQRPV